MGTKTRGRLPTENAKDEVQHEEGADDDEGDEENPVEGTSKSIICLGFL